jgi:outer membrane immunogenic protein
MRSILLATALLFAGTTATVAQAQQEDYRGDAGITYQWVHTNAGPGECGCFGLNGVGITGSWNIQHGWSAVAEVSSEFRGPSSTEPSLTVTSFLGGARYQIPRRWTDPLFNGLGTGLNSGWLKGAHRPQPFAQVLIGPAHSGGGEAGSGDHTYAFAARVGGGIDIPLKSRFEIRAIQIDWFRTQFANAKNDRQNNLLIAAGITYHWSVAK